MPSVAAWMDHHPVAPLPMGGTLCEWHVLLHRVPPRWRTHLVHHADVGSNATTALCLRFVELLWSCRAVAWRAAQDAAPAVAADGSTCRSPGA